MRASGQKEISRNSSVYSVGWQHPVAFHSRFTSADVLIEHVEKPAWGSKNLNFAVYIIALEAEEIPLEAGQWRRAQVNFRTRPTLNLAAARDIGLALFASFVHQRACCCGMCPTSSQAHVKNTLVGTSMRRLSC